MSIPFEKPNNREILEIVEKILEINDEWELDSFIKKNPFFDKYCAWQPVGGSFDNVKFMLNQQANPIASLCEPILNAIDQLLILGCKREGLNPESKLPGIPKTMKEAATKYYKITSGDLRFTPDTIKSVLNENIQILIMDSKDKNDFIITIHDKGTGQKPEDFKKTFLYHQGRNKVSIPFVQGKYGMGSAGPISFSGKLKYCMILSKIHPECVSPAEVKWRKWGFTLVRMHHLDTGEKTNYFEFLCDKQVGQNYDVLSFEADEIPNGLPKQILVDAVKKKYIAKQLNPLKEGTLIKYFNYPKKEIVDVPTLYRRLNIFLWDPVLPISIFDGRTALHTPKYVMAGGHSKFSLSVAKKYINHSYPNGISIEFTTNNQMGPKIIELKFRGTVLLLSQFVPNKEGIPIDTRKETQSREFGNSRGVILVNGQTHAMLDNTFFNKFQLSALQHYLFVIVDFTDIITQPYFKDEFFMPSRDRMKEGDPTSDFKKELKSTLVTHPELIKANRDYQAERNRISINSSKIELNMKDILEKEHPEILKELQGLENVELNGDKSLTIRTDEEGEDTKSNEIDVIDEKEVLKKFINHKILDTSEPGLSFISSEDKEIKRKISIGQERIFIQCKSDFPIEDIDIEQNGSVWIKSPSKALTNKKLQITLFPKKNVPPNQKVEVIIKNKKYGSKSPSAHPVHHDPFQKKSFAAVKEKETEKTQELKKGYGSERVESLQQSIETSDIKGNPILKVDLEFIKKDVTQKVKQPIKPKPNIHIPKLEPLIKTHHYYISQKYDENTVADISPDHTIIYVVVDNKQFLEAKSKILNENKTNFEERYKKYFYFLILFSLIEDKKRELVKKTEYSPKEEKIDDDFESEDDEYEESVKMSKKEEKDSDLDIGEKIQLILPAAQRAYLELIK